MALTAHEGTTRQRLLDAAKDEFAAHGIAGARVDRIAAGAGVNKERIYGYFGSKEKLFDAVVDDALDELAETTPLTGDEDPAEYVGRVYDFHRDNPVLLRLFLWEALHYRDHPLPNEGERAERYRAKVAALSRAAGVPPEREHEAAPLLLTLIGLAAWPNAVPPMARLITGLSADSAEFHDLMRAHVVEFTRKAVSPTN